MAEVNVFGGMQLFIDGNHLRIGQLVVATWSDKANLNCKASVTVGGKEVKSGDTLADAGLLTLTVTNKA